MESTPRLLSRRQLKRVIQAIAQNDSDVISDFSGASLEQPMSIKALKQREAEVRYSLQRHSKAMIKHMVVVTAAFFALFGGAEIIKSQLSGLALASGWLVIGVYAVTCLYLYNFLSVGNGAVNSLKRLFTPVERADYRLLYEFAVNPKYSMKFRQYLSSCNARKERPGMTHAELHAWLARLDISMVPDKPLDDRTYKELRAL